MTQPAAARPVPDWIDDIADRFDLAWQQGKAPAIADFLRSESGDRRAALLQELLLIDLEYRWLTGERRPLACYLAEFPELLGPDGALPEQLVRAAGQLAIADTTGGQADGRASGPATVTLVLRCPQCGHRLQNPPPNTREATCTGCGGSFCVDWGTSTVIRSAELPRMLGKFQLVEVLGQGSFGTVYKATDLRLARVVAIKVPRAGYFATAEEERRFLAEAQHAAQMNHPHIVQVHEIAYEGEMPYIVSDYVAGRTLAEVAAERRPGFRETAELVAQVADALACAHQRKVIHRDVTPRNILIDAAGLPHVTDFGLARGDEASIVVTLEGQVLGTPAYMSPEQAAGEQARIDARSDVYSLGVILYELLTGERPFRGHVRMLLHQLIHDEPRPPRKLNDKIPRDLETICLKAMAKITARRYATAGDMAGDLYHFLKGEPIKARPVGDLERLWRWCRRNPLVASLTAAVGVLLVAVTVAAAWAAVNAEESAEAAKAVAQEATAREQDQKRERLLQEIQVLLLGTHKVDWSSHAWRLVTQAAQIRRGERLQSLAAATLAGLDGHSLKHFKEFPASSVAILPSGRRLVVGGTTDDQGHPLAGAKVWDTEADRFIIESPHKGSGPVAFKLDGTPLQVVAREGPSILVWDLVKQRALCQAQFTRPNGEPPQKLTVKALAITAKCSLVAGSASPAEGEGTKGCLAVWNAATGAQLFQVAESADSLAFSTDGRFLAGSRDEGKVTIWSVPEGKAIATFRPMPLPVHCLAFSPNTRLLAAGGAGGTLAIWDWKTQKLISECRGSNWDVYAVTFSPDGATLASGGRDEAKLWDVATGRLVLSLAGGDFATGLAFTPDARWLAVSTRTEHGPGQVRVWELEDGRGIRTLRGLRAPVAKVCFSPNGKRFAALSHDWQVAIWDLDGGQLRLVLDVPRGHTADNAGLAFSHDGKRFAFSTEKGAKLWDLRTGKARPAWRLPSGLQDTLAFDASGKLLLCRCETRDRNRDPFDNRAHPDKHPRVCRIRNLLGLEPMKSLAEIKTFNWHVRNIVAPADGRYFVVEGLGGAKGQRHVIGAFDGTTGKELWRFDFEASGGGTPRLDPTGRVLAFARRGADRWQTLVEIPSGSRVDPFHMGGYPGPEARHMLVDSESRLAVDQRSLSLFRRGNQTALVTFLANSAYGLAFNSGGNLVAWGNRDGSVSLCNLDGVRKRLAQADLGWPE